jgi:hypothetical protein
VPQDVDEIAEEFADRVLALGGVLPPGRARPTRSLSRLDAESLHPDWCIRSTTVERKLWPPRRSEEAATLLIGGPQVGEAPSAASAPDDGGTA